MANKPPTFVGAPYAMTVFENVTGLTPLNRTGLYNVHSIAAVDRNPTDNFTFSVANTTLFTVNATTGVVSTAASTILNYFVKNAYWFTAVVTDSFGLTATTNVSVSVLMINTPPYFNGTQVAAGYTIGRNSQPGAASPVVITARDRESNALSYSLAGQAVPGMFVVDATGVLSVVGYSLLLEAPSAYWVLLTATGAYSSIEVTRRSYSDAVASEWLLTRRTVAWLSVGLVMCALGCVTETSTPDTFAVTANITVSITPQVNGRCVFARGR